MSYQPNSALDQKVRDLGPSARVLDVGGWHAVYPLATHVVDIMPYETRGQGHHPEPREGERFTRDTWVQADVTDPALHLPYEDKFFDFAICMHTVEDLHEVRPLFKELTRTARRGYIECPSRLTEQTVGVVNRAFSRIGYNHHKWIVDLDDGELLLCDKAESFYQPERQFVMPLTYYESRPNEERIVRYYWSERVAFSVAQDWETCSARARAFKLAANISRSSEMFDAAIRAARRLRDAIRGVSHYPTPTRQPV
jgi:SAM-dependent methyltransferase